MIMFIIISAIILSCLNLNHRVIIKAVQLEKKINKLVETNYAYQKGCDLDCQIKDLLP